MYERCSEELWIRSRSRERRWEKWIRLGEKTGDEHQSRNELAQFVSKPTTDFQAFPTFRATPNIFLYVTAPDPKLSDQFTATTTINKHFWLPIQDWCRVRIATIIYVERSRWYYSAGLEGVSAVVSSILSTVDCGEMPLVQIIRNLCDVRRFTDRCFLGKLGD